VINNVETFANIAPIILNGPEWFNKFGVKNNAGTKVFALAGDIKNTGLVEVCNGTSWGEIIFDIGGGIKKIKSLKQPNRWTFRFCYYRGLFKNPVDYDSLKELEQ
jgi:NADH:ubiquinone oxidoreductase subunit F (NADH-binding)